MGVRKLSDAPGFLGEHLAQGVSGALHCAVGKALKELTQEQKEHLIATIPKIIGYLRSGKARKNGEKGALARIGEVVSAAAERAQEVAQLIEDMRAFAAMLTPEALAEEAVDTLTDYAAAEIDRVLQSPCQAMEGGIKAALTFAPIVTGMELARTTSETVRQIKLLWNSSINLLELLDFDLVADELLDMLEEQLTTMALAMVDEGAAAAEAFISQRLSPEEWIKAVQGEN